MSKGVLLESDQIMLDYVIEAITKLSESGKLNKETPIQLGFTLYDQVFFLDLLRESMREKGIQVKLVLCVVAIKA